MGKEKKKMLLQRVVDVKKLIQCLRSDFAATPAKVLVLEDVGKTLELQKLYLALYYLLSSQQKESLLLPIQNRTCTDTETKQHYQITVKFT